MMFLAQTLNRLSIGKRTTFEAAGPDPMSGEPSQVHAPDDGNDTPSDCEPNQSEMIEAEIVDPPGALDAIDGHMLGRHVKMVFRCWVIVFSLVGAQMGWVLRPFIGTPDQPFQWFRQRESNFFESIWHTLVQLFTG